jgi:glutamate synthase (NADPH/NADH) small chain
MNVLALVGRVWQRVESNAAIEEVVEMAVDPFKRVPVKEQEASERAHNFKEVCLGYNIEEAKLEASRCLDCKNPRCVNGCPVGIDIPGFIRQLKEGNVKDAYGVITEYSALPAICGRVCPQECPRPCP